MGEIAWLSLTSKEQDQVSAILKFMKPKYITLAGACVQPDDIKRFSEDKTGYPKTRSMETWHYTDRSVSPGHTVPANDDGKLMTILPELIGDLKHDHTPNEANALKLAQLGHLVGDIHQPLHVAAFWLPETGKFDRGGNDYHLQDERHNLHYLWDALPTGDVETVTAQIMKEHPMKSYSHKRLTATVGEWAEESWQISKNFVYTTPRGQEPSKEYMAKARRVAYDQIALAGYRLAEVIKSILKSQ